MDTTLVKGSISLIASFSAGRVISQIIKNNTVRDKTIDKIAVPIGSYVLGNLIGVHVVKHVEARITKIAELIDKNKKSEEIPAES